jgi:hypothetical protein
MVVPFSLPNLQTERGFEEGKDFASVTKAGVRVGAVGVVEVRLPAGLLESARVPLF